MIRTLDDITHAVATGARSARSICADALAAIDACNGTLNAFLAVDGERALARAGALDARLEIVKDLPLLGVPVAIKDNICTRGLTTTAGSKILANFSPPYDATVVERLEAAGAVVIGKTNCDEFAMGSSNENSAFGPVRNPWDTSRIPGGSSGGSAAAVAAGVVPVALGSDTGGSVRQPAAHCGVVGLKPTYGRVSRFGLIAFGSSLDQIGPLCRTVRDAARITQVMAGHDPRDATSSTRDVGDWTATLGRGCAGVRVGVPRALLDGIDDDVRQALDAALATLTDLGATVVDVSLPHARFAIPVYYLVATAEASSNLARYDGVRYGVRAPGNEGGLGAMYRRTRHAGFGAEVKRRIVLGTYVLSAGYYDAYYLKAQQVRTLIRQDYDRALDEVDVVAMPTSPTAAFPLGARLDDPLQMYLADIFTVSANLSGLPGISVPGGRSREGLPIGLQLMGRAYDEPTVLQVAHAYEQASPWWRQTPPIFATTPLPDAPA